MAADGTGSVERVSTGQDWQIPSFVTPDGSAVIGFENPPQTSGDIVRFPLSNTKASRAAANSGPVPAERVIRSSASESNAELSPNGRYIAYQSNESGANEIYVRPFPHVDEGRWQVSLSGGTAPVWARDGRELFFLDLADRLTAIPVQTSGATFAFRNPTRLHEIAYAKTTAASRAYDVAADGRRFLMIKEDGAADMYRVIVVVNWFDELKAKVSSQ